MLIFIIVILILALAIYWCYRHQEKVVKFLRHSRWGRTILSWYHSWVFDLKMEDPAQVPKQITAIFITVIIIIGLVAILVAGNYQ